jgi:hypothetical protein
MSLFLDVRSNTESAKGTSTTSEQSMHIDERRSKNPFESSFISDRVPYVARYNETIDNTGFANQQLPDCTLSGRRKLPVTENLASRGSSTNCTASVASSLTIEEDGKRNYKRLDPLSGCHRKISLNQQRHFRPSNTTSGRNARRSSLVQTVKYINEIKSSAMHDPSESDRRIEGRSSGRFNHGIAESAPKPPCRSPSPIVPFGTEKTQERHSAYKQRPACLSSVAPQELPVTIEPLTGRFDDSDQSSASEKEFPVAALYGYEDAAPDIALRNEMRDFSPYHRPLVIGRGAAPRRSSLKHSPSSCHTTKEEVRTPRRASIQVGGEYQTSCEIRRASIGFVEKEIVETIEPIIRLLISHDPSDYWYSKDDVQMMRAENGVLIKQKALGVLSPRECVRGLESGFTPGKRLERQKQVWDSVLGLQKLQRHTGRKDAEYIRGLSMFYSRKAMETANRRAIEDAMEIAEDIRETQKQHRRLTMY